MSYAASDDIMVSVYCLAYKHANYIRRTLEGFVSQKTAFKYEVIIHDDASNDGTSEIIKEYKDKYSDLFIPIIQNENQYSHKIPIVKTHILPLVRGKYVAICEGDDYWTDPDKLQKQVNSLEAHPGCSLCVHKVAEVNETSEPTGVLYPDYDMDKDVIDSESFINMQQKYSFQTSSYMIRSADWKKYVEDPPVFRKVSKVGDVPLLLYFGSLGSVCYINQAMSCYRRGVPTSFSMRLKNESAEKKIANHESVIAMCNAFDVFTDGKYKQFCVNKIAREKVAIAVIEGNLKSMIKKENREYFKALDTKRKSFILLNCVFPHLTSSALKRRRKKLKQQHAVDN